MKTTKVNHRNPLVLLTLLVALSCVQFAKAQPVLFQDNQHYYEYVTTPMTWTNARAFAQSQQYLGMTGHLATLTSQAENDFVASLVPGHTAFLGGFRPVGSMPGGGWQWITGEPFSFTAWNSGEPNDGTPPVSPEIQDVLQVYGQASLFYRTWNDIGDYPDFFIIEFEPVCRALYHFDEQSGTTAIDSCDSWNGTLQNGATRQSGSCFGGSSLSLDGVDEYVSIAPQMLNNLPQGTVEANIWVESFVLNFGNPIVSKGNTTLTEFALFVTSNSIAVAGGQSLDGLTVPVQIPLQTWTKVAVSWDGSMRKLYVNDVLVGQDSSPFVAPNNDSNPVQIGRHNHIQGPFYFHGLIDEVRFSNVAATPSPPQPVLFANNGHYYQLVSCPTTWVDARAFAVSQQYLGMTGHLATITSQAENDFVASLIPGHTAFLGGFRPVGSVPGGGWQWITGEPFSFTAWHSGEPNDGTPPVSPEIQDVLQLYGQASLFYRTWNDIGDYPDAFIIEYEVVPTDSDHDGVLDTVDECPNTPQGVIVDAHGCSIDQLVPCGGPRSGGTWKNHGKYVSAVARTAKAFRAAGLITAKQKGEIVSAAARSNCGKKVKQK